MTAKRPDTIPELFEFYYKDFKPLYCFIQSRNELPVELLFEINAAFDHLSRKWHYSQNEQDVVHAASAHLKRGCFDVFKIAVRETVDRYNQLCKNIDTSIIDNGDFDKKMHLLIANIRNTSVEARKKEGDSRDPVQWNEAYELWKPVFENCIEFEKNYYLNPKIEWAKHKQRWKNWRIRVEGFIVGVLASLIAGIILFLLV